MAIEASRIASPCSPRVIEPAQNEGRCLWDITLAILHHHSIDVQRWQSLMSLRTHQVVSTHQPHEPKAKPQPSRNSQGSVYPLCCRS